MTQFRAACVAAIALVNAGIIAADQIELITWTDVQVQAVMLLVTAVVWLVFAVYAHFTPGTKKEPAMLSQGATATIGGLVAVALAFAWVDWNSEQTQAVLGFGGLLVIFVAGLFTRDHVTAPTTPALPPE